jgi:hypothetical protein
MATAAPTERKADRVRRQLLAHRADGLLKLGFTLHQTIELSSRNDVVHDAEALLERGWPHDFVTTELKEET